MGEIERLVPAGAIERWVYHLRRQRSRAADAIWLIDSGYKIYEGRDGEQLYDATARVRAEHVTVVEEVNELVDMYDAINLRAPA